MIYTSKLKQNQSGLVAITVSLILMILILLIVTSFALIVRREQQQSLDRQLSSQAFYAAESGVNALSFALNDDATRGPLLTRNINTCQEFKDTIANTIKPQIGNNSNSEITCGLVTLDPDRLQYKGIDPSDNGFMIPIETANQIDSIRISWQNDDGSTTFANTGISSVQGLPQTGTSSTGLETAMLRVTLIPGFKTQRTIQDLANGSQTMFLYPNLSAAPNLNGSISYTGNVNNNTQSRPGQGLIVNGNCNAANTPKYCNVQITNIPPEPSGVQYFLHVQSLYKAAELSVQAINGGGAPEKIINSQAVIDVTARAGDVLRRLQVTVPYKNGLIVDNNLSKFNPSYALNITDGICKQLEIGSSTYENKCTSTSGSL